MNDETKNKLKPEHLKLVCKNGEMVGDPYAGEVKDIPGYWGQAPKGTKLIINGKVAAVKESDPPVLGLGDLRVMIENGAKVTSIRFRGKELFKKE